MTRDYVAVDLNLPGRITWRLYRCGRTNPRACACGDYRGIPGKSGLRMIRDQLKRNRRGVDVSRQVRGQVNFRVF